MRILLDVRDRHSTKNPYIAQLARSLRGEEIVYWFNWRYAIFGRYDILHLNWPEHIISHRLLLVRSVNRILALPLLLRLRLFRTAVVFTVHNRAPHDQLCAYDSFIVNQLAKKVGGRVYMNFGESSPLGLSTVIPHGHYIDWYDHPFIQASERQHCILNFGLLKPYKGVEGLLAAFQKADLKTDLVIAGQSGDDRYVLELAALAARQPNVSLRVGRTSDEELARLVAFSELVVLPYSYFYNSGALVMSLSLGTPVLLPKNDITRAWQKEVGAEWVQLYDEPLNPDNLKIAYSWFASQTRVSRPALKGREWDQVGRRYNNFYRQLTRSDVR